MGIMIRRFYGLHCVIAVFVLVCILVGQWLAASVWAFQFVVLRTCIDVMKAVERSEKQKAEAAAEAGEPGADAHD